MVHTIFNTISLYLYIVWAGRDFLVLLGGVFSSPDMFYVLSLEDLVILFALINKAQFQFKNIILFSFLCDISHTELHVL